MIPEINLKLETRIVESKVRELRYSWVLEEPKYDRYRSIIQQKIYNFIKRLKTLNV